MTEEKKQAIAREKARTRCSVCGRLGHWAGDSTCQKGGGSKKGSKKGRGFGAARARRRAPGRPMPFSRSPASSAWNGSPR